MPAQVLAEPNSATRSIVAQQYDVSCGLASLATLMTWAGVKVGEKDLLDSFTARLSPDDKKKAQVNDKGLSAGDLSRIAAAYGFEAKWKKQTVAELVAALTGQPLLVYTRPSDDSGHFSIAEGSDPEHLLIADSILGRYKKIKPEFEHEFIVKDGRGFVMSLQKQGKKTVKSDALDVAAYPSLSERLIYISRSLAGEGRFLVGANFQYGMYNKNKNSLGDRIDIIELNKFMNSGIVVKYGVTKDIEVGILTNINSYYDTTKIRSESYIDKSYTYSRSSMAGLVVDVNHDITIDTSIIYNGSWNIDEDGRTSIFSGGLNYFFPLSGDYYMSAGALASYGFFDTGRKTYGGEVQVSLMKYITPETAADIGVSYHVSEEDNKFSHETIRGAQISSSIMFSVAENLTISPSVAYNRTFDDKRSHMTFGLSVSKKFPRALF